MNTMRAIHRIGVISDTHMPQRGVRLPFTVLRQFEDVELILHAGDLSTLAVLDQLSAYAPVEAVQGNIEQQEVVLALPIKRTLVVGGCEIGLVHILGERKDYARNGRREFPSARVGVSTQFTFSSPLLSPNSRGIAPESGRCICIVTRGVWSARYNRTSTFSADKTARFSS